MSSHAASLQRPSGSPIDVHAAPVQDTRTRSGRGGTALVLDRAPDRLRLLALTTSTQREARR
jgi:hypothetical protein